MLYPTELRGQMDGFLEIKTFLYIFRFSGSVEMPLIRSAAFPRSSTVQRFILR